METTPEPDRLETLRARLDAVDEVPVEERPELFEAVNEAVAAELDALGEV